MYLNNQEIVIVERLFRRVHNESPGESEYKTKESGGCQQEYAVSTSKDT
jgi:hypothetical protein